MTDPPTWGDGYVVSYGMANFPSLVHNYATVSFEAIAMLANIGHTQAYKIYGRVQNRVRTSGGMYWTATGSPMRPGNVPWLPVMLPTYANRDFAVSRKTDCGRL